MKSSQFEEGRSSRFSQSQVALVGKIGFARRSGKECTVLAIDVTRTLVLKKSVLIASITDARNVPETRKSPIWTEV